MDYYRILQLDREPFSNSPDPGLFFMSRQHRKCLQTLEISLRLKRGLNVVCGDVGTGKTTICRQLVRILGGADRIESHLILDPTFGSPSAFLETLASMLIDGEPDFSDKNSSQIRELIKQSLFRDGVDEKKTIVLIIDEGQKIPVYCLEILRELLNYETNEYKLLQIVIFAQREFETVLKTYENFTDRINFKFHLGPLSFSDTRKMIEYRVAKSSLPEDVRKLFTFSGLLAVYMHTGGYPRKIVNLCHKIILAMIVKDSRMADWILVRAVAKGPMHKKVIDRFLYPLLFAFILSGTAGVLVSGFNGVSPDLWQKTVSTISSIAGNAGFVKPKTVGNHDETPRNYVLLPLPEAEKKDIVQEQLNPVLKDTDADVSEVPELNDEEPVTDGAYDMALEENETVVTVSDTVNDISDENEEALRETAEKIVGSANRLISPDEINSVGKMFPVLPVRIPRFFGSAMIKKGETLGNLVCCLYGEYRNSYLEDVMGANRGRINSFDMLHADIKLRFPVLPQAMEIYNRGYVSAELGVKRTLAEAFDFKRFCHRENLKIRVLPFWSSRDRGVRFSVVLNEFFTDKQAVLDRIENMPKDLQLLCRAKLWPDNTLFLTGPPY